MTFTGFQETIYNIDFIAFHIETRVNLGNQQGLTKVNDKFLMETIMHFNLIQTCSFLEEYKKIESYAKDNDEIRKTTRMVSPAIRRLKKYSGLTKLRNSILAHVNRSSDGRFLPYWRVMKNKSFPITYGDINLITSLVVGIAKILALRHSKELSEIKTAMQKERLEADSDLFNQSRFVEYEQEKEAILLQMAQIMYQIQEQK